MNDNWLKEAVGRGVQALVALHLDGAPGHETVKKTTQVWFHVIKNWPIVWNEALDKPRLQEAFLALASQAARWPSPSQLRLLLPVRRYPVPQLQAPDYPEDKAKANVAKIKALLAHVKRL